MKKISILGSTGSIGTQTLDIVNQYPEQFQVVGLATHSNGQLLAQQIRKFRPEIAAICNESQLEKIKEAVEKIQEQDEKINPARSTEK